MPGTAAPAPAPRAPDVLWVPFGVLVLLGLATTLPALAYVAVVASQVLAGDTPPQWQVFPFGLGLLALGGGALLGAVALWRRRAWARPVALVVLPLLVAVGAVDRLVVDDEWGLRLNPVVALFLLLPVVAWSVFILPSVRRYYALVRPLRGSRAPRTRSRPKRNSSAGS